MAERADTVTLSGVGLGIARGTATDRRDLERWNTALAQPRRAARRIGFMQWHPGVGASTLAWATSVAVASRRSEPLLAVRMTAASGKAAPPALPVPTTATEARGRTQPGPAGVHTLEVPAPDTLLPEYWMEQVGPIARYFDVVTTDFGTRSSKAEFGETAALCDSVCLVVAASRTAGEVAALAAAGLAALPERVDIAIAMVDVANEGPMPARTVAAHTPQPVVYVPHDDQLQRGVWPSRFSTRRALLRLAATVSERVDAR